MDSLGLLPRAADESEGVSAVPVGRAVFRDYVIEPVYGRLSAPVAREVADFWLAEGAIGEPAEAARRIAEVVCIARGRDGTIVGVNSAYVGTFERPDHAYYFYRMFIREADRVRGLGARMTTAAVDCLRDVAAGAGVGVRGVVLITENPKLMQPGAQGLLTRLGWTYVGRGPRGRDVWKVDFGSLPDAPAQASS